MSVLCQSSKANPVNFSVKVIFPCSKSLCCHADSCQLMQRPRRRTSSRPAQPQHRPHYRCRRRALSPLRPLPPRRPLPLRRPLRRAKKTAALQLRRCCGHMTAARSAPFRRKPKGREPSCVVARCRRLPPRTRDASDQQTSLHAAQQEELNFGVNRDAAIGLSQTCSDRRRRATAPNS